MFNKHKLFICLFLISAICFAPVPGWQRPAEAWFGLDDLFVVVVGVAKIIAVAAGMTWLEANSRQSTPPPSVQRESGYSLIVSADGVAPELPADGESDMKVKVLVKKDGKVINELPAGVKLFAGHTDAAAELIQINSADEDLLAAGTGDLSFAKIAPRYGTTGRIRLFEYYVDPRQYPEMISVTLKIRRKADNEPVYSRTESEPLNSSLQPFYWNGRATDGSELPPGEYAAELDLLKSDGGVITSPREDLFINRPIGTSAEYLPYVGGNTYLLLTAPDSPTEANDTVQVTLKDLNGERVVAEGSMNFIFKPGGARSVVNENRLTFSSSLRNEVDGVPVKVEVPGASGERLLVTVFDGKAADQVQYEYNLRTRNIVMRTGATSRTYGPGNAGDRAAYYSVLKIMQDMIKSVYAASGLQYDVGTKQLTIDKSKYLDQIDPSYDVTTATSGDIVSIKLSRGAAAVTCAYDLAAGTVSMAEELAFADNYGWDYGAGGIVAGGGGAVAAAGVNTAGLDLSVVPKIISFPVDLMYSLLFVTTQLTALAADINTELQPMACLEDPAVTGLEWYDKAAGLVVISGTADVERASEMKIYINSTELTDTVAWSGPNWSAVNYSRPVQAGRDNKINVLVRRTDGREAESGDVTVYKGLAGQPDLLLLSPRDRMVVASSTYPTRNLDLVLKGKTAPGATINVFNDSIVADTSGNFDKKVDLHLDRPLVEGDNPVLVSVSGPGSLQVNKTVIGAYEFIVASQGRAYILRKGDLLFNGKSGAKSLFDWVVYDPDHTGIYLGGQKVSEAVWDEIKSTSIADWNNSGFYAATRLPKLIDDAVRDKAVARIVQKTDQGNHYDIPLDVHREDFGRFSLRGHYDGPGADNSFYCSELAYWGWETTARECGIDLGVKLEELLFPARGTIDTANNSLLPAYLCEKTVSVKQEAK